MTAVDDRDAAPAGADGHAPLVLPVSLGPGVDGWFTGRAPADAPPPAVGAAGNLSHRRPHEPPRLAADRRAAFGRMGLDAGDVVWMQQVHGAEVAVVDEHTPRGAEVRGVDALVTVQADRPIAVQVADCVPVLLSSPAGVVAVAHAGRRGVELGIVPATLAAMEDLGAERASVAAAIGPAIGGCCYEVPSEMREDLSDDHPVASGTTSWGTPSLDLPAAVAEVLRDAGVGDVARVGSCTRCDDEDRWFSHRADPTTGRQVGVVVRRGGQA
ncbi:MAG: polyphenol oxidase family protein [Actinobacteria bacterium]|nr:polyphenol oxidase family protein [Actinomycetota bacterium]